MDIRRFFKNVNAEEQGERKGGESDKDDEGGRVLDHPVHGKEKDSSRMTCEDREERDREADCEALERQNRDTNVDREDEDREATCEDREEDEALCEMQAATSLHLNDLGDKVTGPKQIKLSYYPQEQFGSQKRSFQSSWFQSFTWLEYSQQKNAAFCFACRVFGRNLKKDMFVHVGFKNWKKALIAFHKHESTQSHKDSLVYWQSYKASASQGSVIQQLETANVEEIRQRREYVRRIVAVTCMLGKQGIPFRGHDEKEDSDNKGNFLECMSLLTQFDPFLQRYAAPSNTTYLSKASQNEMITCCSQEVTATIVREMLESNMYAIMADEARTGKSEQLAICVRYVTNEGTLKERLLALTELTSFDAVSISAAIEKELQEKGIGHLRCVAQTYDGAAVMSGVTGGVQSHFRKRHPEAIYVHCYAHELNLVLCHTCRAVTEATEFFEMLESLHSFFSCSLVNHHKFVETQKQLGLRTSELVQLSSTRWACQVRSVKAVMENLPAIIECLSNITTPIAVGLKTKLCKFSSVYILLMFHDLLSVTAGFHKYLQKETIDLAQAVTHKDAVCDSLKEKRSDATAADLHVRTMAICSANQISVEGQSSGHRKRKMKQMDDFVVETSCGSGREDGVSDLEQLKRKLLFPCLDRMIAELERRFSDINVEMIQGIQACCPTSQNFLSEPDLTVLAQHYRIDLKPEEVIVARNFLKRKAQGGGSPNDMITVYNQLDGDMFPSLKTLIQAAITIPVSSCSCERSFSALRRLHTWLRGTMGQNRLHHLAVMSVERDVFNSIDQEKLIDRFASIKDRRYSLIIPSKN